MIASQRGQHRADLLIVDDTPDNLRLLSNILVENGYKVRKATSGERALKAAAAEPPDAILLDIMMPDMNGYETCAQLKAVEALKEIPVIFMSALDDAMDKVLAFNVGGVDYITKPFQVAEVLARVETHLKTAYLQRQLQDRNQQLEREIEERQKAETGLRVFLHAVSHDLRNPITGAMLVTSNLLAKRSPDRETIDVKVNALERILRSCQRQLELIDTLVETQQGDVWGKKLNRQPTQLDDFVRELMAAWEPIAQRDDVTLRLNIAENLAAIAVDRQQLWRVFDNFLSNATRHNPPGTEVVLSIRQEGAWLRCEIADNGRGIPEDVAESLFDLYARSQETRRKTGLGLGLYLCRQIVEAHGGTIGVESQPGQGATFWFTLPVQG